MKGNFKFLWMTLLMITMLSLCATASAQSFKAIYCASGASASNPTLYFVYDTENYTKGGTFTPEEPGSTPLVITELYTTPVTDYNNGWTKCPAKTVNFQSSFADYRPTTLRCWFYEFKNLVTIENISNLKTSSVTDMSWMFYYCEKLTSLDLHHFDTSNVTDMNHMFYYCSKLTRLDLSDWDTSNVTNMNNMFNVCSKLTSLNVSHFVTSKVTDMSYMFYYCYGLTSLDVSHFDTSKVTDMNNMFNNCHNLTSLDVSHFDTSKVTDMSQMFDYCQNLTGLNVSDWNTSNVTNMGSMFSECINLKSNSTSMNVSSWDTSNVTTMGSMFNKCESLTSLDVSGWNTANVTNMYCMFSECINLKSNSTSMDVSGWNTANVTDMRKMFLWCSTLTSLDLRGWNTSSVTDMSCMFQYCKKLESLTLSSNFDTSNVKSMNRMFMSCEILDCLDLSSFKTSNVTDMKQMFYDCKYLESLTLSSNFNTAKVTDMSGMFGSCEKLMSLTLSSNFNTSNVTDMSGMFSHCYKLTSLNLSGFNTANVTNMESMFNACENITSYTFPSTFSMDKIIDKTNSYYIGYMFNNNIRLRFIDFSASDDTDAITTIDRGSLTDGGMFYQVPATTVIYLPHGAAKPSGDDLRNVVYTSGSELHCDYYYSKDKTVIYNTTFYNDIELPREFKAAKAEYSRDMSNKFGTCILPYEFHSNSDIQAYTLTQEHPKTMYFEEAATVPAHTSFLFQKLGNAEFIEGELGGEYNITVNATRDTSVGGPYEEDFDVTAQETTTAEPEDNVTWTTQGYYVKEEIVGDGNTFYIAQDKFWQATMDDEEPTTIPPHRATFCGEWWYDDFEGAPSFSIMIADHNGETTTISALDVDREDAAPEYFDASGRRQSELQPGLNIVRKADGTVVKVMRK